MEPATALGLAAGVASVVVVVSRSITTLRAVHIKFSETNLKVELLVGQLHTVRTALTQVQEFINQTSPLHSHQLAIDLNEAVEHCRLLVQHIDNQIARLNKLPNDSLTAASKATMLLEERVFRDNIQLLNSQISALNLCLTAFRCRIDAQPMSLCSTHTVELPTPLSDSVIDGDETPTIRLANSLIAISPRVDMPAMIKSRSYSSPAPAKKFDFDWPFARSRSQAGFHRPGSRASTGSHDSTVKSSVTLKNTMLKLSNALAQSMRVDQALKRDSLAKDKHLRILALGQHPATTVKRLRFSMADPPTPKELSQARLCIVPYVIRELLSLSEAMVDKALTRDNMRRLAHTQNLESFESEGGPKWAVSAEVYESALSIWQSSHVQSCFKLIDQEASRAYFLKAIPRVMHPHYTPSTTDVIKMSDKPQCVTEAKLIIDDMYVDLVDVPQPKLRRLFRHYEDADAFLFCLDLSTYNQYSEDIEVNELQQALRAFKKSCGSPRLSKTPVFLLMRNTGSFRRKLAKSPLEKHFPNCKDVKTFDDSIKWLLKHFQSYLRSSQLLWHHCAYDDTEDDSTVDFVRDCVVRLPQILSLNKNVDDLLGGDRPVVYLTKKQSFMARLSAREG